MDYIKLAGASTKTFLSFFILLSGMVGGPGNGEATALCSELALELWK